MCVLVVCVSGMCVYVCGDMYVCVSGVGEGGGREVLFVFVRQGPLLNMEPT